MSRRKQTARRNYIQTTLDDDLPLAHLFGMAHRAKRTRKNLSPKKVAKRAAPRVTPPISLDTSNDVISIDDGPEATDILENVNSKVGDFISTGGFISSDDEEETEMIKTKSNKKPSPDRIFISDDSDNELIVNQAPSNSDFDISQPGTSAGTSNDNNLKPVKDDIMEFVDSVLCKTSFDDNDNKQSNLKDMKSLEDFRKETEEMLKNASLLLNEFKTGARSEPEPKPTPEVNLGDSPTKKVMVNSCPICLESLATRQASVTVCGHIFCEECIIKTAKLQKKCPTCRKAINTKKVHRVYF